MRKIHSAVVDTQRHCWNLYLWIWINFHNTQFHEVWWWCQSLFVDDENSFHHCVLLVLCGGLHLRFSWFSFCGSSLSTSYREMIEGSHLWDFLCKLSFSLNYAENKLMLFDALLFLCFTTMTIIIRICQLWMWQIWWTTVACCFMMINDHHLVSS